MRKYETIIIQHPTLDEESIKANLEKFENVITSGGGTVESTDVWGKRKLAYETKKVTEGHHTLLTFNAPAELPKELDRIMRITDGLIRHMICTVEA